MNVTYTYIVAQSERGSRRSREYFAEISYYMKVDLAYNAQTIRHAFAEADCYFVQKTDWGNEDSSFRKLRSE